MHLSVQFTSVQSFERLGHRGDMRDDSAGILFQSFSAGGHREQFWLGQGCLLFDVVHPAFSQPTTASPTLQGALKNSFGDEVVACDMPEACKFPSFDSRQRMFLWTNMGVDFASHPVVGLVLQVGDAERFLQALGFGRLDP